MSPNALGVLHPHEQEGTSRRDIVLSPDSEATPSPMPLRLLGAHLNIRKWDGSLRQDTNGELHLATYGNNPASLVNVWHERLVGVRQSRRPKPIEVPVHRNRENPGSGDYRSRERRVVAPPSTLDGLGGEHCLDYGAKHAIS
jgi:hypothetical protein